MFSGICLVSRALSLDLTEVTHRQHDNISMGLVLQPHTLHELGSIFSTRASDDELVRDLVGWQVGEDNAADTELSA